MKKITTFLTAVLLIAGIAAFAGDKTSDKPVNHKTTYQLAFTKLIVRDDIDVTLEENPEKSIEFAGTDANIAKVDWRIKDGVLYISSKKGSLKGKVNIRINVSQLKEITVKGNSELRSDGELNSAHLKIYLDGSCFISVRNKGNINIVNDGETEIEVKKAVGNVVFG